MTVLRQEVNLDSRYADRGSMAIEDMLSDMEREGLSDTEDFEDEFEDHFNDEDDDDNSKEAGMWDAVKDKLPKKDRLKKELDPDKGFWGDMGTVKAKKGILKNFLKALEKIDFYDANSKQTALEILDVLTGEINDIRRAEFDGGVPPEIEKMYKEVTNLALEIRKNMMYVYQMRESIKDHLRRIPSDPKKPIKFKQVSLRR